MKTGKSLRENLGESTDDASAHQTCFGGPGGLRDYLDELEAMSFLHQLNHRPVKHVVVAKPVISALIMLILNEGAVVNEKLFTVEYSAVQEVDHGQLGLHRQTNN